MGWKGGPVGLQEAGQCSAITVGDPQTVSKIKSVSLMAYYTDVSNQLASVSLCSLAWESAASAAQLGWSDK